MKKLLSIIAIFSFLTYTSAFAEIGKIDLSKLTCGELTKLSDEDAGVIMVWLDGYFSADLDPVIDFEGITYVAEALGKECSKNLSQTLFQAISKLGE